MQCRRVLVVINLDKKTGIYQIRNIINNKIYIGQSLNIKTRFLQHKQALRKNRHPNQHLQNAWNKYGKSNAVAIYGTMKEKVIIERIKNNQPIIGTFNYTGSSCLCVRR